MLQMKTDLLIWSTFHAVRGCLRLRCCIRLPEWKIGFTCLVRHWRRFKLTRLALCKNFFSFFLPFEMLPEIIIQLWHDFPAAKLDVFATRGGVLEDVLGLEDTFWSPWPWPRSLKTSKIVLSSARGQHYFLNRWNFVGKRQKPRGKFANTFFVFLNSSIGVA